MDNKAAYAKFLQTPFWHNLRRQKFGRHPKCERCGSKKRLQCHHKIYRATWQETQLEDLEVLCVICHRREHGLEAGLYSKEEWSRRQWQKTRPCYKKARARIEQLRKRNWR